MGRGGGDSRRHPRGAAGQKSAAARVVPGSARLRPRRRLLEPAFSRRPEGRGAAGGNQALAEGADGIATIGQGVEGNDGKGEGVKGRAKLKGRKTRGTPLNSGARLSTTQALDISDCKVE